MIDVYQYDIDFKSIEGGRKWGKLLFISFSFLFTKLRSCIRQQHWLSVRQTKCFIDKHFWVARYRTRFLFHPIKSFQTHWNLWKNQANKLKYHQNELNKVLFLDLGATGYGILWAHILAVVYLCPSYLLIPLVELVCENRIVTLVLIDLILAVVPFL